MEGEGAEKDPCLAVYNDNFKENIEVYFDKTVKLLSQCKNYKQISNI